MRLRDLKTGPSKEFLWAICIALAIALVSVLLVPPYQVPQINPKQQTTERKEGQEDRKGFEMPVGNGSGNQTNNGKDETSEFWFVLGHRVKITDSLLVVFALLLWLATHDLVKGGAEIAERQLRAYVFPKIARIDGFGSGLVPEAIIIIKNTGLTPAYDVTSKFGILLAAATLSNEEFPPLGDLTDERSSRGVLGPSGEASPKHQPGTLLSDTEIMAITNGQLALYLMGRIEYLDVFKKSRFTNVRLVFGQSGVKRADGTLSVCPHGNDAD